MKRKRKEKQSNRQTKRTKRELKPIEFDRPRGSHGCFSNLSQHKVKIDDIVWLTSEHYFQAQKFKGTEWENIIRETRDPRQARTIGNNTDLPLREEWEEVRGRVMCECIVKKFTQHEDLKKILFSTKGRKIIYTTNLDDYWGNGEDGYGENKLGMILVGVRDDMLSTMKKKKKKKNKRREKILKKMND